MRKAKVHVDIKPVSDFDRLIQELRTAANQIESGKGIRHHEAKAELRRRFLNSS